MNKHIAALGFILMTLGVGAARADWQNDFKAAQASKDKAEAARLYLSVAKDETASMDVRWVAVVNAGSNPQIYKGSLGLRATIAETLGKEGDSGNYYFQAVACYRALGKKPEMMNAAREALAATQSPLDNGGGLYILVYTVADDLKRSGDLAGAASLYVQYMDRMGDHLVYGLDALNTAASELNAKNSASATSPADSSLIDDLKKAEKTGRRLSDALKALGIQIPADFAEKQKQVLELRDQVLAGKATTTPILPYQLAWYGGSDAADKFRKTTRPAQPQISATSK